MENNLFQKILNICIILDSTGSMGESLNACKNAINSIMKCFKLITNIELTIIIYGDYERRRIETIKKVVTVLQGNIETISMNLDMYKLCQNGMGGDSDEASTTAFNVANDILPNGSHIIHISDAFPHILNNSPEANMENIALRKEGKITKYRDIGDKLISRGFTIHSITSVSNIDNHFRATYGRFNDTGCLSNTNLTTWEVKRSLFLILNNIIGGETQDGFQYPDFFKLPTAAQCNSYFEIEIGRRRGEYYKNFRTFIEQNAEMLELVGFLSKEYFNYMRTNKLSAEHSALCDTIKSQGINKAVIDWFKEQGAEKLLLTEINMEFFGKYAISKAKFLEYIILIDMFKTVKYSGRESIKELRTIIESLILFEVNSDTFDGEKHIMLDALIATPSMIGSFICYEKDNVMREIGLNPILVSAILQWCKIDEIKNIFIEYIKRLTFMNWSNNCDNEAPATIFAWQTLEFIVQGLKPYETNCNKYVMDHISNTIKVSEMLKFSSIPRMMTSILVENMKRKDLVKNVDGVYMAWDVISSNYFPINLFLHINLQYFNDNIKPRMQDYFKKYIKTTQDFNTNPFFKRFGTIENMKKYYKEILPQLFEEYGSLFVSIYSIHLMDNIPDGVGLPYMIESRIDRYTYENQIKEPTTTHPSQDDMININFEDICRYYNSHIGHQGEFLINRINIVSNENIKENGTKWKSCTRKNKTREGFCGTVYMVLDTSANAEGQCAGCRINADLHHIPCECCKNTIAMACPLQPFTRENCVFCNMPTGTKDYQNVRFSDIVSQNIEAFSKYLGIPSDIISRLISNQNKASRALRIDNGNGNLCLIDNIFSPELWKKSQEYQTILYNGNTLDQESSKYILELIENAFKIFCPLCCDETNIKATHSCHKCNFQYCFNCCNTMYGNENWFNKSQDCSNYSCPACKTPIQKGFAKKEIEFNGTRKEIYNSLDSAIRSGILSTLMETPGNTLHTCGNPSCESTCRSFIREKRACGGEIEEEEDSTAPDYIECHTCKSKRKDIELSEERRLRQLSIIEENMLPTGHYINEDGMVYRECPWCGILGIRTDNACWNMTCTGCNQHYNWATGDRDNGSVYGDLDRMFGSYYVSRTEHVDPCNTNLYISTVDGPVDFESWTPRQLELLERARNAPNYNDVEDEDDEDDDDIYNYGYGY